MALKSCSRALIALVIGCAAFVGASSPADAVDIPVTCQATLNGQPLATADQTFTLLMDAPAQVAPGATFTATIPARTVSLPATSPPPQNLPIASYSNLSTAYRVTGGTPVPGSASAAEATIAGDLITLSTPGPVPPGAFNVPAVTFQVAAGAAGTTIVTSGVNVILTINLVAGISPLLTCNLPANTLSSTQVIAPGAPSAGDTTVSTAAGAAVSVDLNTLITPAAGIAVDPATLTITVQPTKGTLSALATGVVTYTPNPGTSGPDTFSYQVCSVVTDPATPAACDTGTVTVNVTAPPTVQSTPPTTAAPAPQATGLPRTGDSSGVLAFAGFAFVGLGVGAVFVSRRCGAFRHVRRA